MSILQLLNLSYSYNGSVPILNNLTYSFEQGKVYAVAGYPGEGKTTLLYLLSGLADPTGGTILFDGQDIRTMDHNVYRSRFVGTVLQRFSLLPNLNAVENVQLSMDIAGIKEKDKQQYAMAMLNKVGLSGTETKQPISKLSIIDQLRAAIARVISYNPPVILVDEPADACNTEMRQQVMDVFYKLAHEENKCVILTTCSSEVIQKADIVYELNACMTVNNQHEPSEALPNNHE